MTNRPRPREIRWITWIGAVVLAAGLAAGAGALAFAVWSGGPINGPATATQHADRLSQSGVAPSSVAPQPPGPGGGVQIGSILFPSAPGPPAGTGLTPYTGPTTFMSGTTVIENKLIGNRLTVPDNSTATLIIRNSRFEFADWFQLQLYGGSGHVIEHNLFDGRNTAQSVTSLDADRATIRLNEFTGSDNAIRLGSDSLVEFNYIHAMNNANPTSHTDGVEFYGGRNSTIRSNYIDIGGSSGATGAVNIATDFGPIDNVLVENNEFRPGGTYSVYVRLQGAGPSVTNVRIIGNRWYSGSGQPFGGMFGTASIDPQSAVTVWSENRLDGNLINKP